MACVVQYVTRSEYHFVRGVGKQTPTDPTQEFNPQEFEQAIHSLQKLIQDTTNLPTPTDTKDPEHITEPSHTILIENESTGERRLRVHENTTLHNVTEHLPSNWDVSILLDKSRDNGYAIRTSYDCGGGILVYATIMVQDDWFIRLDIGHTSFIDPEDDFEITHLSPISVSARLLEITRALERSVTSAYAYTIESAAVAFDYIATKPDSFQSGQEEWDLNTTQTEWASIRGKSRQTVSKNVRKARERLLEIPDTDQSQGPESSLIQFYEDADDPGDIRLV